MRLQKRTAADEAAGFLLWVFPGGSEEIPVRTSAHVSKLSSLPRVQQENAGNLPEVCGFKEIKIPDYQ